MPLSSFPIHRFFFILSLLFSILEATPVPDTSAFNQANKLESITKNGSTEGKIIAVASMAVGVFVAFTGYRLFKASLAIAGFLLFANITFWVMIRVEPESGYANRDLLLLLVPAALGLLGAFIAYRLWRFGLFLIGALGGASLANLLMNMGLRNVLPTDTARIVFVIIMAILGGFLIHFIEKPAIICSTALLGSYTAFLGLDTFTDTGFNTSLQNVLFAGSNAQTSVSGSELGMVAGVIVLFSVGSIYQFKSTKNHKHRDDY